MNLLETLTRAADEEQLKLQPLPEHAAAGQEEHLRQHYALLLAAVLTAQPSISEPQTRLLRLLLDSLKLGDIRGTLFEQARALKPEPLLEAARLIREAGFAHHLIVDALVLLRLDAPLGDEAARLVGELASFLGLDEDDLSTRAQDTSDILGLESNEKKNNEEAAEKIAADRFTQRPELWPSRLSQPLTAEALREGLQGGLWYLDSDLMVNFPWKAEDAFLIFRHGATLNSVVENGEIKLTDCHLVDALLSFTGKCAITLERCHWRGDYAPEAERTALNSIGSRLTISDCEFITRNARAILVKDNELTLTGSRFTHCGHEELDGGAVCHSDHARVITGCYFDHCLAAHGGAIWVNKLKGVSKCEFVACQSLALQDKQAEDVAVYAKEAVAPTAISGCVFRQTSLAIGSAHDGSGAKFVCLTQFQQGNVYYHHRYSGNLITNASSFEHGCEIERLL